MDIKANYGLTQSDARVLKVFEENRRLKRQLKMAIDKNYKGVPVVEIDKGKKPNGEEEPVVSSVYVYATDEATLKLARQVENTTAALAYYLTIHKELNSTYYALYREKDAVAELKSEIENIKSRGFWARVFNK